MIEVIKFGADWCNPCKMVAPTVDKLKTKYNDVNSEVQITSIDVDRNPETAKEYRIMSIPAFVFKLNGDLYLKKVGILKEDEIEKIINEMKENGGSEERNIGGEVRRVEESNDAN